MRALWRGRSVVQVPGSTGHSSSVNEATLTHSKCFHWTTRAFTTTPADYIDSYSPVLARSEYNSDRLKHSDHALARSLSKISREWDAAWLRTRLLRDLLVRARFGESLSLRLRLLIWSLVQS